MLADAAQAVEGKLYILGGGWSVTGPEPSASAIAAYIQVPWDRTNVSTSSGSSSSTATASRRRGDPGGG